ncbi:DUF2247 family protein [Salinactinospora qingdaonensis]|uniref:DUF2247 family protein n=2 Tax=Salinactinospora qingdaonensis TaxID=702744 RepID=A0ABP7FDT1_9ACTN
MKTQKEAIEEYVEITPGFLKWLYEGGKITGEVVVACALREHSNGNRDETIASLALLLSDEMERVADILASVPEEKGKEDDFWEALLYIDLSLIYERRERLHDPLGKIEDVYSDYDYPPQIAHLVRYMPSERSDSSKDIYDQWAEWLAEAGRRHGKRR